ncbi:MAG: hypothetical protein GEU73_01930 [Chloroflexi bacterium]|nr:hypothetical protein [Chloroflexota bacterium]
MIQDVALAVQELSFHIRLATAEDAAALREIVGTTLSHPHGKGRRAVFRSAAQRGELLVLERYDPKAREWRVGAFVDWHMRVDDVLTIRDIGTEGEVPHSGMVKQLIMELIRSLSPVAMSVKVRADATEWNDVIRSITGFSFEGSEYRRPHWINVWRWSRESAERAAHVQRAPRFRR